MYLYYFVLEKGHWLFIWINLKSLPNDALCKVWLKLAKWFWRRRWKWEKFTDGRTDGQTDAVRHVIMPSAQVCLKKLHKYYWASVRNNCKSITHVSRLLGLQKARNIAKSQGRQSACSTNSLSARIWVKRLVYNHVSNESQIIVLR